MPASVLTIGSFDGVHCGHAALLQRARTLAAGHDPATRVIALVFDPHPLAQINPIAAPARLTRFEDRQRWLMGCGAHEVVRLEPRPELLGLTPQAFVEKKIARVSAYRFCGRD